MIRCDTPTCQNDAIWKTRDGARYCDRCKRNIAQFEKKHIKHKDQHKVFTRETR